MGQEIKRSILERDRRKGVLDLGSNRFRVRLAE